MFHYFSADILQLFKLFNRSDRRDIAVTVVTYEEQMRGWLNVIRRGADNSSLILGYGKLNEALEFFCNKQVLVFTGPAATEYARLLQQKLRVGTQDLRIAAHCFADTARVALSVDGSDRCQFGYLLLLDIEEAPAQMQLYHLKREAQALGLV